MKHNNLIKYAMLSAAACVCLFSGCVTNYGNIEDVNMKADIDFGVGLPVGTVKLSIEDFLGSMGKNIFVGTNDDQYNGVNYNHILLFRDTFPLNKSYTEVHMTKYNSASSNDLFIAQGTINGKSISSPLTFAANASEKDRSIHFPVKLKINHVKNSTVDSLKRLDKMVLSQASLISMLSKADYPALSPTMIERIDLTLGKQFTRQKGNELKMPFTAFDTQIKRNIDDFTISFMIDDLDVDRSTIQEFEANINDVLDFDLALVFKPGCTISFDATSKLRYDLKMQDYIYEALYGYFKPGKQMHDRSETIIENEWDSWKKLKELQLNATQPFVRVTLTTEVAAPLYVHIDTLWVRREKDNLTHYAHFKNGISENFYFGDNYLRTTTPIGTSITNEFWADYIDNNGDMDQLLNIRPDILGYNYRLMLDRNVTNRVGSEIPQHRLTQNMNVDVDAEITIPFVFSEGMNISYTDTMEVEEVFSKINFDSIANNVGVIDTVKTADVKVLIHLKNKLPFDVKFAYEFLDKNGKVVNIDDLITNTNDTVIIPAPVNDDSQQVINNQLNVLTPAEKTIVISADREKFDLLASVTDMRYTATIMTNPESFKSNSRGDKPKEVVVYDNSNLTIQLKATADANAQFDFSSLFEDNKDKENK
ncbi:MAG: hypothetical protein IJ834_01785 [Paludibacteraceae bacterium]|nr:hypothetical protein [Paludibacteraceae bacterium]